MMPSLRPDYRPVRPPLSARWSEWSALIRPARDMPPQSDRDAVFRTAARETGPVLVLPGLARGDGQTRRLRRWLGGLGFDARGWGMGVDIGPTRRVLNDLPPLLDSIAAAAGPVNLVGLSMGGLFARWLAQRRPASVRQVVTVCSPFRAPLDSFFLPLRHVASVWPCDVAAFLEAVGQPPPVPTTCLYTVTDGTVAWTSCLDPDSPMDNVEFEGVHVTMAVNPAVCGILRDRLARPWAALSRAAAAAA